MLWVWRREREAREVKETMITHNWHNSKHMASSGVGNAFSNTFKGLLYICDVNTHFLIGRFISKYNNNNNNNRNIQWKDRWGNSHHEQANIKPKTTRSHLANLFNACIYLCNVKDTTQQHTHGNRTCSIGNDDSKVI